MAGDGHGLTVFDPLGNIGKVIPQVTNGGRFHCDTIMSHRLTESIRFWRLTRRTYITKIEIKVRARQLRRRAAAKSSRPYDVLFAVQSDVEFRTVKLKKS